MYNPARSKHWKGILAPRARFDFLSILPLNEFTPGRIACCCPLTLKGRNGVCCSN